MISPEYARPTLHVDRPTFRGHQNKGEMVPLQIVVDNGDIRGSKPTMTNSLQALAGSAGRHGGATVRAKSESHVYGAKLLLDLCGQLRRRKFLDRQF